MTKLNLPTSAQQTETIAAICTPPGDGGVAMIRISGSNALSVASKMFSKKISPKISHKLTYGSFIGGNQEVIDSGLLTFMKGPNSYTGEDVIEIFCHGGRLVTQRVLERAFVCGAIPAQPGEFTQRAFLNKKLDLAQAEAVQNLIAAKNEYALKMAQDQLSGRLSQTILDLQKKLTHQAAILEAWVDFPEEGIEFCTLEEIENNLQTIYDEISRLCASFHDGQALKEGFKLSILGRPNVGKSSLLNQLLKKDKAIVTPIAGTTRDLVEDQLIIEGMQYYITDTAGIRSASDEVEKIGIEKAKENAKEADLVLLVLDASVELTQDDKDLMHMLKEANVLYVYNKIDLGKVSSITQKPYLEISAKCSLNIDQLYKKIAEYTAHRVHYQDQIYLTQKRHFIALQKAKEYLFATLSGLKEQISCEWISYDLKSSLKSLGEIIGFDVTENILSDIFKNFCVGK